MEEENLYYIEENSMFELYQSLKFCQKMNNVRFSNINIQRENNKFSCIALRNEVLITSKFGYPITMGGTLEFPTIEVIINDI